MSDVLKLQAAQAALEEIRDGMVVGLGSGSTASIFIRELGKAGVNVVGIPTSEESRRIAEEVGVRLTLPDCGTLEDLLLRNISVADDQLVSIKLPPIVLGTRAAFDFEMEPCE